MALLDIRWLLWPTHAAPAKPKRGRHRAEPAERPLPATTDYLYPRVRPPKKHHWN